MNRPGREPHARIGTGTPPVPRVPPRRGYVLLVTLGLLVLSTTLLVAVGRAAAGHALAARTAQSELQRRWAVASCRAAVLPYAEQILASVEQEEHRPAASVRATVRLGDDSVQLVIADEQAKANVNLMIDQFGVGGAEDRLRQAMAGTGTGNHVRLRPAAPDDEPPATRPVSPTPLIFGPGQLFDSLTPDLLFKDAAGAAAPMQAVTCWGTGRLNVMRADETAMRAVLFPALTRLEISRLIVARDKTVALRIDQKHAAAAAARNTDAIGALLAQAQIDAKVRNRLPATAGSTCHSLRVTLRDRRRAWYWLAVADESDPAHPRADSIVW